jgi:glycosyltransferase involved in cell wall biosynthesis
MQRLNLNNNILVISSWAPPRSGTQFLYNLLINFDENKYKIFTSSINFKKEFNYGSKLPCEYILYDNENPLDQDYAAEILAGEKGTPIARLIVLIKILKKIILIIKKGVKIIKDKNIDVILGISDIELNLFYGFILSKLKRKPYIVFLFDIYKGNYFIFRGKYRSKIMEKIVGFIEPIILKSAKRIIVTNEETKRYYLDRYGDKLKVEIVHNSNFTEPYDKLNVEHNSGPSYEIVFTGNIYWPQERSLINMFNAVEQIDDLDIKFFVYSPNVPDDFIKKYKKSRKIIFFSSHQSEMPKIQNRADILFLPLSWNTPAPDIIKTATPGKLTDYLISGRPILIHAPRYAYVCEYAKENNFAHVVDEENIEILKNGIRKILTDADYSRNLIYNARKVFFKNHEAVENAKLLLRILNEV